MAACAICATAGSTFIRCIGARHNTPIAAVSGNFPASRPTTGLDRFRHCKFRPAAYVLSQPPRREGAKQDGTMSISEAQVADQQVEERRKKEPGYVTTDTLARRKPDGPLGA